MRFDTDTIVYWCAMIIVVSTNAVPPSLLSTRNRQIVAPIKTATCIKRNITSTMIWTWTSHQNSELLVGIQQNDQYNRTWRKNIYLIWWSITILMHFTDSPHIQNTREKKNSKCIIPPIQFLITIPTWDTMRFLRKTVDPSTITCIQIVNYIEIHHTHIHHTYSRSDCPPLCRRIFTIIIVT